MDVLLRALTVVALFAAGDSMGDTRYVSRDNASPAPPYTNWATAATSLDDALGAASLADEIWISAGVYCPTSRLLGFVLKHNLCLYGGFAGNETFRWERNSSTNLCILSGDMDHNDQTNALGYVQSALSTNALFGSNSHHVISWPSDAGMTNVINGLVVTAGHGREDDHNADPSELPGAGICATGPGVLEILNCRISGNRSGWGTYGGDGGGVYSECDTLVSNCVVQGNCTGSGISDGGSGGGLYVSRRLTLLGSGVESNATGAGESFEGSGGSGGGFCARSETSIADCQIRGNSTGSCLAGRGHGGSGGGGASAGAMCMARCVVANNRCGDGQNTGGHGGGLFCESALTAIDTDFRENRAGAGTNHFGSSGGLGGGFLAMGHTLLCGVAAVSNSAGRGEASGGSGGGFACDMGSVLISNSIMSANNAGDANDCGGQGGGFYAAGSCLVTRSVISDNRAGDGCMENDSGCGGGIYARDCMEIRNSLVCRNAAGNGDGKYEYGGSGGGVFTYGVAPLKLIGTTIAGNRAGQGTEDGHGGGVLLHERADIYNSILCGNTVKPGSWGPDLCRLSGGPVNVCNSVVGDPETNSINGSQVNVFDWDVESVGFVDLPNGNFRLKYGSPCINAGTNDPAQERWDLAGGQRIIDCTVDIGAYEYDITTADSNMDGIPDAWHVRYNLDPTNTHAAEENNDSDSFDNLQEWIADTDPTNSESYLYIAAISNTASTTVSFMSSSNRVYTLLYCTNLIDGSWADVPGQKNLSGLGGWGWLTDTNIADPIRYYRLSVSLP